MESQGYKIKVDTRSPKERLVDLFSFIPFQILLLLAGAFLAYSLTFDVPFYLDDYPSIRENPAIRDLGNLNAVINFAPQRFIGYITFAINYSIHEYDLAGYHIINLAIHCLTAVIVFFIARQILVMENIRPHISEDMGKYFPLLVASIFVLHPLQTQAVTYIVQRSASLAACFYLFSMLCYIRARLASGNLYRVLWLFAVAIAFVGAVFTKQNTVSLPLSLFLIEVVFFGLWGRKLMIVVLALLSATALTISLIYFFIDPNFFASLSRMTQETVIVSRLDYLAIQAGVIWGYIAKFILPFKLHLDYDLAVRSFSEPLVLLATLAHICVLGFAFWSIRTRPLIAFAILFYYLAHSVESGLIPIRDFAFEHRTYLPNFGLSLLVAWLVLNIAPRKIDRRLVLAASVALIMISGSVTFSRNSLWRDNIAFFTNETELSPNTLRTWSMLAESHLRLEQNVEAARAYSEGIELLGSGLDRRNNTVISYYQNFILAMDRVGYRDNALAVIDSFDFENMDAEVHSTFSMLRGNILAKQEKFDEAEQSFIEALQLFSGNHEARLSFGKIQMLRENLLLARQYFVEILTMDAQSFTAPEARALIQRIDAELNQ